MLVLHDILSIFGQVCIVLYFIIFIIPFCLPFFRLFFYVRSKNQQTEYEKAMNDLTKSLKLKRFSDMRILANDAIDIIEKQKDTLANTKENVCIIIRTFYDDHFMTSLEEIWSFWARLTDVTCLAFRPSLHLDFTWILQKLLRFNVDRLFFLTKVKFK